MTVLERGGATENVLDARLAAGGPFEQRRNGRPRALHIHFGDLAQHQKFLRTRRALLEMCLKQSPMILVPDKDIGLAV